MNKILKTIKEEAHACQHSLLVYECGDGCCTEYDDFVSINDLDMILDNANCDIQCKYCNWFRGMEPPMPPSNEADFPLYFGKYENPKIKYCPICGNQLEEDNE